MTSDLDLLRQFARENSQDTFAEIVRRHLNLVYSAALRQVRSPQLAEEIAQSVFADLSRNAGKLVGGGDTSSPQTLTPWLYAVTRRTAIDVIRKESRRQLREQIAVEMNNMDATTNAWMQIEPLLDDAMAALDETDRSAVLLRYFENKSLHEVGAALGASEDAAQKRVKRAVDRLRDFFSKRNVGIGASGLAVLISANAVQASPVGLAVTISAAALAGTTVSTSAAIATTKIIAMTTLQKSVIGTAFLAAVGAGVFEAHKAFQLQNQVQNLREQQAPLAEQIQELRHERDDATNRLAALAAENQLLQSNSGENELLKLRAEVTQLQQMNAAAPDNSRQALIKSWLERRDKLKQLVEQNPDKSIPEFQLISEQQWLDAAMDAKFDTDKEVQRDLANLRQTAENNFVIQMHNALQKFQKDNHNQFPTDLSQLQPYFETPVDPAILNRWEILPQSALPNQSMGGDWVITEKSPVDQGLDMRWAIGPNGFGSTSYPKPGVDALAATLQPAIKAYAAANNGQQPTDPSQLQPYLTTPEQQSAFHQLVQMRDSATNAGTP